MKTIDFIRKGLEGSAQGALLLIDDMKDAPLTFPTPRGGNHPLWVLGHMAHTEGEVIQHMMLGNANPVAHWGELFGMKSEPTADASRYPAFDEIREKFLELRGQTMKLLDSMSDADLDQPPKACPPQVKDFLNTYAQCFLVVIYNTMTHRGQVADARRAAGRKPLRM
ncbi:MAG TPA: DinB family protein [Pirellulales bacterium]|nr:DinB family protein [Pirellulales bacterium]